VLRRAQPAPRRSHHVRHVLTAAVVACAALLAVPASTPRGEVLDLVGAAPPGAGLVSGLEPAARETGLGTGSQQPTSTPSPAPGAPDGGLAGVDLRLSEVGFAERRASWHAAPKVPPVESLTGYVWPIAHPRLTLPFGPTPWGTHIVDGERFHDGIDLATFCGDRIVAAHAGSVLAASRHFDQQLGWIGSLQPYFSRLDAKGLWATLPIVVVIDDGDGYRSVYAHFERIVVRVGQQVHAGQLLGYEGATGHASGCHLHYGLFSPVETATFRTRPDVARRMKLPAAEIARVDPQLVLPPNPRLR
jgi:murein DD-endopeptidase MepM/ murein hydrolase activator NlpD